MNYFPKMNQLNSLVRVKIGSQFEKQETNRIKF